MLTSANQSKLAQLLLAQDKEAALALIATMTGGDLTHKVNGVPLICLASQGPHSEVVAAMLAKGAKVDANASRNAYDAQTRHALHYAQSANQLEIALLLLQHCPDLREMGDQECRTPLHDAARTGKFDFMKLYLGLHIKDIPCPCDVDLKDNNNKTPLHEAIANGHHTIAKLLVDHGATSLKLSSVPSLSTLCSNYLEQNFQHPEGDDVTTWIFEEARKKALLFRGEQRDNAKLSEPDRQKIVELTTKLKQMSLSK